MTIAGLTVMSIKNVRKSVQDLDAAMMVTETCVAEEETAVMAETSAGKNAVTEKRMTAGETAVMVEKMNEEETDVTEGMNEEETDVTEEMNVRETDVTAEETSVRGSGVREAVMNAAETGGVTLSVMHMVIKSRINEQYRIIRHTI